MLSKCFVQGNVPRALIVDDSVIRIPHHITACTFGTSRELFIRIAVHGVFTKKYVEPLPGFYVDRISREPSHADPVSIRIRKSVPVCVFFPHRRRSTQVKIFGSADGVRSEEHTSELQSRGHLV